MADQVEAPKLVKYVVTGSDADEASVTKVTLYLVLVPGEGEDDSNRQGHVYSQIITRS